MTAITNPALTAIAPAKTAAPSSIASAPANDKSSSAADAGSQSKYGPAVKVTLSPPAKAIVDGQAPTASSPTLSANSTASTSTASHTIDTDAGSSASSNSKPSASAAPKGAAPAPVAYDTTAAAISSSRRKVAAQVGVADANQLVDKNGNIDKTRLAKEVAEQQKQAPIVN